MGCLVSTALFSKSDDVERERHLSNASTFIRVCRWETAAQLELQRAISVMRSRKVSEAFIVSFEAKASASALIGLFVSSVAKEFSSEELRDIIAFSLTSSGSEVVSILHSYSERDLFYEIVDRFPAEEAESVIAFLDSPLGRDFIAGHYALSETLHERSNQYFYLVTEGIRRHSQSSK